MMVTCLSGVESVFLVNISTLVCDIRRLKVNFFRRIEAVTLSLEAAANSKIAEAKHKGAIAVKIKLENRRIHAKVAVAEAKVIKIRQRRETETTPTSKQIRVL